VTFFPDGSRYAYGEPDGAINVAWLDAQHPFPTGDAPPDFIASLVRACRQSVNGTRGLHVCELCPPGSGTAWPPEPNVIRHDEGDLVVGSAEIRVRANDGIVYAAPTMVVHYVLAHRYLPPAAFVEAVLARH
jgi:hypothetical protein